MSPSKYSDYSRPERKPIQKMHPVWRGVGFAFIVLIPIMSWAGMDIVMKQYVNTGKLPVPADMIAQPGHIFYQMIPDPYLYVKTFIFLVIAFLFYMAFLMIASIVTRIVMGDPSKADPYYVAPMARRRRVR